MKRKKMSRLFSVVLALTLVVQMAGADLSTVYAAETTDTENGVVTGSETANFDFESGLDKWNVTGDVAVTEDAQDGEQGVVLQAGASISTTITDIAQGSYTLSSWVKGTAGKNANITVTNTGAPDAVLLLDTYMSSDTYTQTGHRNVIVYNGQMTITITAGTTELYLDSLSLAMDSEDENTISNWDFEDSLDGWKTTGTVTADTTQADTGDTAVCLTADSELSQVVTVEPNTKYSVTMRAKVTTADTFDSEDVYYDGSTTDVEGKLVNRTSLGDRVNLGVRGVDGTVLRQAPSATEDYSLISVTFTTGADTTQVEVYANTICDQAYKDSITLYKTEGTELADDWSGNGDDSVWVDNFDLFSLQDDNYIKGADVSFLPVIEDNDGKYFANGVEQDCLRILSNHGVNSITSMIFVQAGNAVHDPSTLEVLSNDWYYTADGSTNVTSMVQGGYFDKTHSLELGERATELGMSYLPSFHYSDYWMSNAKAYTPQEWIDTDYEGNLSNTDIEHMQAIVYNYVYDFMKNLADNDVNVVGVKLGNEQNGGLAWPTGKGATTTGHAAIIAASYEAVEDAMPGVSGYVHSNNGYTTSGFSTFFQALLNNGAEFDGTAFSLYGGRSSGNIITMANQSLSDDTMKYMDYVNVETGFSFTKYQAVSAQQTGAMGQAQYYATSGNGQYNWLLDYMQAGLDTANPYGQTRGFYYWETDWIPTPGAGSSAGGTADICGRTMFNNGDTSIQEMGSTQSGKAGDMMDSMYAYLMRGCAKNKEDTMQTPLRDAGTYSVEVTDPTGISLSKETMTLAEGEKERLQPTITPSDKVLSDSSISYTSTDPSVASVTKGGYVCALSAGTATVTATVKGGYSASVAVTVTAEQIASGVTLKVDGTATTDAQEVSATVNDKLQMSAALSGTYDDDVVVYTSSNPDVASFFGETWQTTAGEMRQETSKNTKVQLNVKSVGTTEIKVATVDGSVSTSIQVTVGKTDVTAVKMSSAEESISYNRTVQLSATVEPADTTLYLLNWVSDDPSIATVDENGLVKGVGIGDTTIRAVSDDNSEVYGTCTIHVLQVQAEGITLDKSSMTIQTGSTKNINALVTPDDTYDKSVTWSSDNEAVATVNENGEVTGITAGTAKITAVTAGGTYSASCNLTVQTEAIPVTGVTLSEDEYYFASDYFSETNQTEDAPVYRIYATTEPETATNSDVTFSSDTPEVATVDAYGRITAISAGVAKITATTVDGSYTASMNVYVPSVSEDYDNMDTGSYTLSASSVGGGTMSGNIVEDDENNVLQVAGSGNGGRGSMKKFASAIANDKIVVDLDWEVGKPVNSNGAYIALTDSSNNCYLILQKNAGSEMVYSTGGTMPGNTPVSNGPAVGSGFATDNAWYHVHAVIDSVEKTVTFTVTSKDDSTVTATNTIAFATDTSYTGALAAIQFYSTRKSSMSWTTQIDNINVYAAAPVATAVTLNKDSVKLIPIEGTRCTSCQLSASVVPETAGTDVTWKSSDANIATVSDSGLVTAAKTYQSLDEIETGSCTVTATSVSNPSVSKDITVTISNSPNASEFFSVKDTDGNVVYETATGGSEVVLESGDQRQFYPVVTGGDGDTDIANLAWVSDNTEVVSIDAQTGELTAVGPGTATVTLTVTLYTGDPLVATIPFTVNGVALVKTTALSDAITVAKAAKDKEDYYYENTSLEAYNTALTQAQSDLETASSEKWTDDKQSVIDADVEALNQAVEGLTVLDVINITSLELGGADNVIPVGQSRTLTATTAPEGANEEIVWTSSNPDVVMVGRTTGKMVALATGSATITATSKSGAVSATKDVTVSTDLTSYYEENGVTVSGTNENRPATNAFVNAQTMNLAGGNNGKNAWTTGSATTVGEIKVDLGREATITDVKTAFWSLLKYTIDVSDDGENWTTVCDHSQEAAGALSSGTDPYTDEMPEGTTARYVRLNVLENGGTGWVGITVMQVNGAFTSDTRLVENCAEVQASAELNGDLAAAMPQTISATLSDGTTEDTTVTWNADDLAKAQSAAALGTYAIRGSILVDGMTYDVTGSLTVTAMDISSAELTLSQNSFVYDGTAREPEVTVMLGTTKLTAQDYDVTYESNTNVGTAKVTVTAKGNYAGSLEKNFAITSADLSNAIVSLETASYTYDGKAKEPDVIVTWNGAQLGSEAYDVSYADNVNAGTATVTITGKENYTGSATATYTIARAVMSKSNTKLVLSDSSYSYDGTEKKPDVSVLYNGTALAAENYAVSYANNKNVGTATVTVAGTGNYTGNVMTTFKIEKVSIKDASVTLSASTYTYDGKEKKPAVTVSVNGTKLTTSAYSVSYKNNKNAGTATVTITGKGSYTGTATATFTIKKATKKITVKKTSITKTYGDKAFSLGASVSNSDKLTYSMSNKTVLKITNGKASIVGCGKVVVTLKSVATANYSAAADKKITITVKPKAGKLSSVKNSSSKKVTVSWSKDTKVSGYEVSYATAKNFKGAKTITVKSNKTTKKTISKLTKGKTYYVRVRSYKTVDGKKLYGAYSSVKSVKIKK